MIQKPNVPAFLVVTKDVDGSWTVRDAGGLLLGRFAKGSAAVRFAERERRSHPTPPVASSNGARPRIQGRLTMAYGRSMRAKLGHDA